MSFEGILPINKPPGFTSFDVVAKLRGITKTRRIGHSGTLDPIATGVLPVFFGRATKAIDLMPNHDKEYIAQFKLGVETDTQDITGKILAQRSFDIPSRRLNEALLDFSGIQSQIPPMFSAVQVNGKRLYDLARQGVEIERSPRTITIYSLDLLNYSQDTGVARINIKCSRGTYIRTICHDIGQKLGCGAVMTELCRTSACGYGLSGCITLDDARRLMDEGALERRLLPVCSAFTGLHKIELEPRQAKMFLNGVKLAVEAPENCNVTVFDRESGRFLGIAKYDGISGVLKIIKLFTLEAPQ